MNVERRAGGAAPAALSSLPPRVLAARMADAVIARRPPEESRWTWEDGALAEAVDRVGRVTGAASHQSYAAAAIGRLVNDDGRVASRGEAEGDLRDLQPGILVAHLSVRTGEERFHKCLHLLIGELLHHPRTRAGGFWSSRGRPFQMWLDASAAPFHAQCLAALGETDDFDDAVHQLLVMEERARDPRTGLPSHAWDESRRQLWSNPESGRSPTVWTRALGVFGASAVDTYDVLPPGYHGRPGLAAMIRRLAAAVMKWQDPATGLWSQVIDQPGRKGNFPEASGSLLLSYTLAKAARIGCFDDPSGAVSAGGSAHSAFCAVGSTFLEDDHEGVPHLLGCSAPVLLGGSPYRDGTFSWYASAPVVPDEPAGLAALMLASLERDAAGSEGASGGTAAGSGAAAGSTADAPR